MTSLKKPKPRIDDAGLYSLSNRLGKGLHVLLAPQHGLESRLGGTSAFASSEIDPMVNPALQRNAAD